jgi:hypothetical protein
MASEPRRPRLTDPHQAQELFTMAVERRFVGTATALLVCCDRLARPLGHIHLQACAVDCSPSELSEILDALVDRAGMIEPTALAGLALGLTRPGGDQIQPYDRAWFRALYRTCHRRGLDAHGVYLVTRTGARMVTVDDAA